MDELKSGDWETFLKGHPKAHLLQSAAWGDLKSAFGWEAHRLVSGKVGAQILLRRLPLGFHLAYIPKGPIGPVEEWGEFLSKVDALCREKRAAFLKIEPDAWEEDFQLTLKGFTSGKQSIQPRRTIVVDLIGSEEGLLARMKQKTRYNIHLAEKKDIQVLLTDDILSFYRLMTETGHRDGFGVHNLDYFQRAYDLFHPSGDCELLVAQHCGQNLAGLMVFRRGKRAWYLYGASNDLERNRMPAYLLQWEAMRWARGQGCSEYDLWGVPDAPAKELEDQFEHRSDGLWGVYRFKRGFGGELKRSASSQDRVYIAPMYALYQKIKAG
ncbi:MAG TPA: peptidoglycan bridge formation glycyltransferase FemA/FemB family protein [Anaerolineaceae bacterium]|nr:peptidoglycan bridge formation glycyltransferase FemA/FemB family protein [Anaerolineaceae bacterium]